MSFKGWVWIGAIAFCIAVWWGVILLAIHYA